jgi:hypothetical protein
MLSIQEKEELILTEERKFADAVGRGVIEKPKLSIWMILIPVIFVHFFYRLNAYKDGRKQFVSDFIKTRQRALEEAASALASNRKPDATKLLQMSSIPEGTAKAYIAWLKVLLDHYGDLLSAEGDSFDQLVKAVYRSKGDFLLSLNTISDAEKQFDRALKPHLNESTPGANGIVATMEKCCADLRRKQATSIFG